MVMLPDYPDRGIASQRVRIERASLFMQMALIAIGAWWLFESLGSVSSLLFRFGPVLILFSSALLIPDLVDFGPVERTRISTASCIFWPPLLAFAEVNRSNGADLVAVIALVIVAFVLLYLSMILLKFEANSRRWRGLSTLAGFGLAIPVVAVNAGLGSWIIVSFAAVITAIPPLLAKDGLEKARKEFYEQLKKTERRILQAQSDNNLMQQPSSLLKTAREEGRKNPEKGMQLVRDAEWEADRILSFVKDLSEIRKQSEASVVSSEEVTGFSGESRRLFEMGVEELGNGSLRRAEQKFREAKERAITLQKHWASARHAISEAEKAVGSGEGHLVEGLRETLKVANKAMEEEDPEYALSIVSEIPNQMGDVGELLSRANKSIEDAEKSLSSSQSESLKDAKDRIIEAKEAIKSGNPSLAIGLAEGVTRSIRSESEAQSNVLRALRQRKTIEERIPSGGKGSPWLERLDEIELMAKSSSWLEASESLASLTSELDSLNKQILETREMLDFLNEDWKILRKRLESSGIGPESTERSSAERALAMAEEALSEGRMENCLDAIGRADSAMESLRRRV